MTALSPQELEALEKRYTPPPVPPCRVCGGELSPASIGPDGITWACSLMENDPEKPGHCRQKADRGRFEDSEFGPNGHYSRSRVHHYRSGDEDVLALLAMYRAGHALLVEARKTIDDLCWKLAPLVRNGRHTYPSDKERDGARNVYGLAHDVLAKLPKE